MRNEKLPWTILFLFMTALAWPSRGQICPSQNFVVCASWSQRCTIPANTEGYISYGNKGKYTLTPFKTFNQGVTLNCRDEFGDILPGQTKWCCYQKVKLDINTGRGYTRIGSEYTDWKRMDVNYQTVRFGLAGKGFLYLMYEGRGSLQCAWSHLGNWIVNEKKNCDATSGVPLSLKKEAGKNLWRNCGPQNGQCTGLEAGKTHWVRFGVDGKFTTKLVSTTTGEIRCHKDLFRFDPVPGRTKACDVAMSKPSFSAVQSKWVRIQSCAGQGCVSELSLTEGITNTKATSITQSFTESLTITMRSGINFEIPDTGVGLSHETELSLTISHSLTTAVQESLTRSRIVNKKFTCTSGALYQWVYGSDRLDVVDMTPFQVRTSDYVCIDDRYTPKCPPTFCVDDNCQQCRQQLAAFAVEPSPEEHVAENGNMIVVGPAIVLAVCVACVVAACAFRGLKRQTYTIVGDGENVSNVGPANAGTRLSA